EAEFGLLIELPSPVRLVLLGQVTGRFPTREAPVVQLKLDVLGWLDFGAKTLGLDGHLYDSRIAMFAVSGDLALRVAWGAQPLFVLSIGGFHPHFQAPPGLPELRRITLALGASNGNPRLTLEAYVALTSNSFQLGARAEVYADFAIVGLHGYLQF